MSISGKIGGDAEIWARQAGCRSILVLSDRTSNWISTELPEGCIAVVPDLLAAAERIVTDSDVAMAWTGPRLEQLITAPVPGRDSELGTMRACER